MKLVLKENADIKKLEQIGFTNNLENFNNGDSLFKFYWERYIGNKLLYYVLIYYNNQIVIETNSHCRIAKEVQRIIYQLTKEDLVELVE